MIKQFIKTACARVLSSKAGGRPRLEGKVAVVTGAGGGIGRQTCLLFSREGASLVIADFNQDKAEETKKLVSDAYPDTALKVFVADVSKQQDCQKMIEIAEVEFGALDILFNNAGVMLPEDDNAETTSDETWNKTFAINVKGVFYGCKYGIPAMRRAGGGSIINTASFVSLVGAATPQLAYTSSKGAVLALTRELAVVHGREGIRINALCPGPVRTDLLMKFLDTEEKKQRRLVHVPMGRFGESYEMAAGALFLASDEASFVTGTEFLVDGGLTAAYVTPEGPAHPLKPQN